MKRLQRVKITEEERNKRVAEIEEKWDKGAALTKDDKIFSCDYLRYDKLLLYPYCVDEFFIRTFFSLFTEINERQKIAYHFLVREWEAEINKTNHPDPILQTNTQETREELKLLRANFNIAGYMYTSQQYEEDKTYLLEWSKYRYLITKRLIEQEFPAGEYTLTLNHTPIILDHISIAHIFTRHYGQTMKPYITDKSHFSQHIYHEEIHIFLEDIFNRIDASGHYIHDSILQITFRYLGALYRIYCNQAKKPVKGLKKPKEFVRLRTIFPLEDPAMLDTLASDYIEKPVDAQLSIFVQKAKPLLPPP